MNRSCLIVLIAAVALAVAPAPAGTPASPAAAFRLRAPVVLPDFEREEVASLVLPARVYAETTDDLRDVRVLGAGGTPVPWRRERVARPSTTTVRRDSPARILSLTEDAEANRLAIMFELEEGAPVPDGLEFITPLRDFERSVRVEGRAGSDAAWIPLAEDAVIFDARRFMDIAQREVRLAPSESRQFRLVIGNVTDIAASPLREITRHAGGDVAEVERLMLQRRAFRIDRVRWWREVEAETGRELILAPYPVEILERHDDTERKQTRVRLATGRAPLTQLTLVTPDLNFHRPLRLYALSETAAGTQRREIARGTVERLQFRALDREQLTLAFPEHRGAELELVIDNGDSAPLGIAGVQAEGVAYRLLFFVQPGAGYRLYFGGDPVAPPPSYDTVALDAALAQDYTPLAAALGPAEANPEHQEVAKRFWERVNAGWLMAGALGIMVLLLGGVLVRSVKQLEKTASG